MPVIPTLRKLREEACEFKISLSYIVRACPKKKRHAYKHIFTAKLLIIAITWKQSKSPSIDG
jgi:hypothetical protein